MALKCSPDIAQSIMKSVLAGIDDADVSIDDVDQHISVNGPSNKLTGWVIGLLQEVSSPGRKKIDAILHMDCPRNATKLCMFTGCINYYRDMWPSCAHILKHLTDH
ncbi:hypothetical protein ACHAW6_000919 [Cyclotella cf. meneghiniana]